MTQGFTWGWATTGRSLAGFGSSRSARQINLEERSHLAIPGRGRARSGVGWRGSARFGNSGSLERQGWLRGLFGGRAAWACEFIAGRSGMAGRGRTGRGMTWMGQAVRGRAGRRGQRIPHLPTPARAVPVLQPAGVVRGLAPQPALAPAGLGRWLPCYHPSGLQRVRPRGAP